MRGFIFYSSMYLLYIFFYLYLNKGHYQPRVDMVIIVMSASRGAIHVSRQEEGNTELDVVNRVSLY